MEYTNEQHSVATYRGRRLLLRALAGTGKTETVALRVMNLIDSGVPQEEVLCLCFTNAAADQLRNRLEKKGLNIRVSTIDGYSYSLFSEWMQMTGNKIELSTCEDIVEKLLIRYGIGYNKSTIKNFLQMSSLRWFGMPLEYLIPGISPSDVSHVLEDYDNAKRNAGVIDFTDLTILSSKLKKKVTYQEVILDEAQDANAAHISFIESLSTDAITLVGDENQSIFGFAGVSPTLFDDFCGGWDERKLTKSFRHSVGVLNTVNSTLQKDTLSTDIPGGSVTNSKNLFLLLGEITKQPGTKAIIARTKNDLYPIVMTMKSMGIDVGCSWNGDSTEGTEFFMATIHYAKGLEWDNVLIVNAHKEGFKGYGSDIGLNTRLSYVAASRAKNNLFIHTVDGESLFSDQGETVE